MKAQLAFFFLVVCSFSSCQNQAEEKSEGATLRLPLTFVEGFELGRFSYALLAEEHSREDSAARIWVKTYLPVKGIPDSWRGVKKSMIELNGKDKAGLTAVIVDANNNLDFSDDQVFYPKASGMDSTMARYSEEEKHYVNYEVFQGGKVIPKRALMVIKRTNFYPLAYAFPQYATAKLKVGEKEYTIALSSGGRPDFDGSKLALIDKNNAVLKGFTERIDKGELLSVGGLFDKVKYRNRGVNMYHETLQLESEYAEKIGYSLQTGYPFQPFKTKLFKSDKTIASIDYKGKYLFIDFWGTWCGPCVAELPELQRIYEGVDKQRVEFVSIAGEQSPELLEKFLKKRSLLWPQIISDDKNKLIETYNIDGYPTNVLIGPDGRIVAKNLHGKVLEEKLAELTIN